MPKQKSNDTEPKEKRTRKPRTKKADENTIKLSRYHGYTIPFKPYTDFCTENFDKLTTKDVWLKPIIYNRKVIGVLTRADEEYIYGIINMKEITLELELNLDTNLQGDEKDKYEKIYEEAMKETEKYAEPVFASQKRPKYLLAYDKYYKEQEMLKERNTSYKEDE